MAKETGAKVVCGEDLMEDFLSDNVDFARGEIGF